MTDLYKIKPLVWRLDEDGDWVAGGYYIRQFGASYGWGEIPYSISNHGLTLEAAQSAAEAHYRQRLAQHLEPVSEAPAGQ